MSAPDHQPRPLRDGFRPLLLIIGLARRSIRANNQNVTRLEFKNLVLWGTANQQSTTASNMLHQSMAAATNLAYQTAWNSPKSDVYRTRDFTISTVVSQFSYTLPAEVMEVAAPVRCAGLPLTEIQEEGDFFGLNARFGLDLATTGTPQYYFLKPTNAAHTEAEAITLTMLVAPTPSAIRTIDYNANVKAPRYSACDLEDDAAVMHGMNGYIELYILPLAKEAMMATANFYRQDIAAQITREAEAARAGLGIIQPASAKREAA